MSEKLTQEQIDAMLNAMMSGGTEDIAPKEVKRNIKDYDFHTPPKFSKEHLRSLEMVFDTYSRALSSYLTGYLRTATSIGVANTEQVIYREFTNTLINPVIMAMVDFSPLKGNIVVELSTHIGFCVLDRILGGPGLSLKKVRDFSEIEIVLLERVMSQMLTFLVEPWSNITRLAPKLEKIETNSSFAQIISPSEATALVSLDIKIGTVEGLINFVIPHMVVEKVMDRLNTRHWFTHAATDEQNESYAENIEERIEKTIIPVKVIMGKTKITVRDFAGLSVGDLIPLDTFVNSDLTVTVGDRVKFKGKPGTIRGKNAVKITSLVDEEGNIRG